MLKFVSLICFLLLVSCGSTRSTAPEALLVPPEEESVHFSMPEIPPPPPMQEKDASLPPPREEALAISPQDGKGALPPLTPDGARVTLRRANRIVQYHALTIIDGTEMTHKGEEFSTLSSGQIVFLVINGGSLTLEDCTINKGGINTPAPKGPQGELAVNAYGLNSAIVAIGEGSVIKLKNCTITCDSPYSNALMAIDGASISSEGRLEITTLRDFSRGLVTSYGGSIQVKGSAQICTDGYQSPAVYNARESGAITLEGKGDGRIELETLSANSPSIHAGGTINASSVFGRASKSEAIVLEGDGNLSARQSSFSGNSRQLGAILIFGDAKDAKKASLTLQDTTISDEGGYTLIYVANNESAIRLSGCTFFRRGVAYASENDFNFLLASSLSRYGEDGKNGGKVSLLLDHQSLYGIVAAEAVDSTVDVIYDVYSTNGLVNISGDKVTSSLASDV